MANQHRNGGRLELARDVTGLARTRLLGFHTSTHFFSRWEEPKPTGEKTSKNLKVFNYFNARTSKSIQSKLSRLSTGDATFVRVPCVRVVWN